jgi:hypothetical protein
VCVPNPGIGNLISNATVLGDEAQWEAFRSQELCCLGWITAVIKDILGVGVALSRSFFLSLSLLVCLVCSLDNIVSEAL